MEGVFQKHLKAIIGGRPIPHSVYYSSWISNTKLESYIAAHRSEENVDDDDDVNDEKQPSPNTSATTTTATSRSTTTATTKIKLGYLLATTVLLITVYQDFKTKYREAAAKLAFGLGLIWTLYVAHSKDATAGHIHHSHQEEKEEKEKEREHV
ncbi:hypothetical protein BGZ88_012800 [Linnemannia elongata]|nr:hypothetical protein BGZ88_012800 [Linnemannia elongata]